MHNEIQNKNEYIFAAISRIITLALGVVFSIISTRYMGPTLKGTTAYILSVVEIMSTSLTLGIHHAYPYYRNKYGREQYLSTYVSMVLYMYSFFSMIAIIYVFVVPLNMVATACVILSPLYAYNRVLGYAFLVESPNRKYYIYVLSGAFEIIVAICVLFFIPRGILVAILLISCMNFFQSVLYTKWAILEVGVTAKISILNYTEVLKYGFFPMISLLLTNLNYRIDIIMLGHFRNVSMADIGIYGLAVQIADKVGVLTDTAQEILLSHLAKGRKEKEVAVVVRICIFITALVGIIFILTGKILIPLVYGEEFSNAYYITSLCLISPVVIIVFKMVAQYNIVMSYQKKNAFMLLLGIIVNIILNMVLVPVWGIVGAACATIAGNIVCALAFLFYFSWISGIKIDEIVIIKAKDFTTAFNILKRK